MQVVHGHTAEMPDKTLTQVNRKQIGSHSIAKALMLSYEFPQGCTGERIEDRDIDTGEDLEVQKALHQILGSSQGIGRLAWRAEDERHMSPDVPLGQVSRGDAIRLSALDVPFIVNSESLIVSALHSHVYPRDANPS